MQTNEVQRSWLLAPLFLRVAQRTGATTYYIEIFPVPLAALGGKRPVLALAPGAGDVDVVVASELLEAGRAISNVHLPSSSVGRRANICWCDVSAAYQISTIASSTA